MGYLTRIRTAQDGTQETLLDYNQSYRNLPYIGILRAGR